MFFVVRSNDSFNFPLGWIKYIVIVVILQPQTILFFQKHPIMVLLSTIGLYKILTIPNFVTIQKHKVWFVSRHLHVVLSTTNDCWQSHIWHTCAVTPKHIRSVQQQHQYTHTKMWQRGTSHKWQQKVEDWCRPLVLYNII